MEMNVIHEIHILACATVALAYLLKACRSKNGLDFVLSAAYATVAFSG
jgi:hypothetical protein